MSFQAYRDELGGIFRAMDSVSETGHGQEMETLAGHVDLTGAFVVATKPAAVPAKPVVAAAGSEKAPATAPAAAPAKLTPEKAPGKLAQPERKP